jgi:LAO/AO transport system kinase
VTPPQPSAKETAPAAGPIRLDHIGIAVRSIAAARCLYESLGFAVGPQEAIPHEGVRTAMIDLGHSRVELLEPIGDESTIGRFLARHGEGIHHMAVHLPDLDAVFARLRASGIRLTGDRIQTGAGGHRYFFVHPQGAGGVLLEVVGDPAGNS